MLIHCAAGIHRTGTVSYSLLRLDGKAPREAYETLKLLRQVTYEGVGDWRIQLAETMILQGLVEGAGTDQAFLKQLKSR